MIAGGGKAPVNMSVVSTTPTRPVAGSLAHDEPSPPSQPYLPTGLLGPTRRTWTPTPKPQPCEPSGDGPGMPRPAPVWSVVIASTVALDNSGEPSGRPPPLSSMRPKAQTSSTVDTSPPAADGKAGGFAHWPLGGSKTTFSPVSGLAV